MLGRRAILSLFVLLAVSGLPAAARAADTPTQVSAGRDQTCAVLSPRGGVMCWGEGIAGQLGDGTSTASPVPIAVSGISGATARRRRRAADVRGGGRWPRRLLGARAGRGRAVAPERHGGAGPRRERGRGGQRRLDPCLCAARHRTGRVLGSRRRGRARQRRHLGQRHAGRRGRHRLRDRGQRQRRLLLRGAGGRKRGVLGPRPRRRARQRGGRRQRHARRGQRRRLGDRGQHRHEPRVRAARVRRDRVLGQRRSRAARRRHEHEPPGAGGGERHPTAVAVAAGGIHTCAVLAGGAVECWGYGGDGQLGLPARNSSATPVANGVGGATGITAGLGDTCVLLASGGVQCWGVATTASSATAARCPAPRP